jgi:ubiquinone/menaquinone biosynthesis C-methylase UbiE
MVLISNMLFQTENKINILKEAKRILQKDGFLVIID